MVPVIHRFVRGTLCAALVTAAALFLADPIVAVGERVLCEVTDPRLAEVSGMTASALHEGIMWVHNDSGDAARLYALDLSDCAVVGEVFLRDRKKNEISARDIEGIASGVDAQGRAVLWVADIGDNLDSWESVAIYRVREPENLNRKYARAFEFGFTYEDRPHNAEAILADPKSSQLWIVTKQLASGSIYALPANLSRSKINIAQRIGSVGSLITDATMRPEGSGFLLRDYFDAYTYQGMPPGEQGDKFALPAQIQGEAIAFTRSGDALITMSEKDDRVIEVRIDASEPTSEEISNNSSEQSPSNSSEQSSVNYWPLVLGIAGGSALVTGLIIMSRKPKTKIAGNNKNAE